jgi:hypothetical protein
MQLEIGPDGKIIGTRRVSPNGQVSGLTEYSGREVLVILPGRSEPGAALPWFREEEVTRLVNGQIRQAFEQYRILQDTYSTPWEATRSFMEAVFGGRSPDLLAEVDRWIKSQVNQPPAVAKGNGAGPGPEETGAAARARPDPVRALARGPRRKRR